jgi:hypothetical protein
LYFAARVVAGIAVTPRPTRPELPVGRGLSLFSTRWRLRSRSRLACVRARSTNTSARQHILAPGKALRQAIENGSWVRDLLGTAGSGRPRSVADS